MAVVSVYTCQGAFPALFIGATQPGSITKTYTLVPATTPELASYVYFHYHHLGLPRKRKVVNRVAILYEATSALNVTVQLSIFSTKQTLAQVNVVLTGIANGPTRRAWANQLNIDAEFMQIRINVPANPIAAISIVGIEVWYKIGGDAFEST